MELNPCPFCGCKKVEVYKDPIAQIKRYKAVCLICSAQIYRGGKQEAIEAWNRRVRE